MRSIEFLRKKFETKLKNMEMIVVDLKKTCGYADIDETLNSWLEKIIPNVIISDDEEFIIVTNDETEFILKTGMVMNAWQQNLNHN